MITAQHHAGVPRPHRTADSARQELIGSPYGAREVHLHAGVVLLRVVERQVPEVVHRAV